PQGIPRIWDGRDLLECLTDEDFTSLPCGTRRILDAVRSQAEPWGRGHTYNCTCFALGKRNLFFCTTNQTETVYR
ncbi:MAG: hypothetical protein J0M26_27020, partial [Planctomycetes bacterium]|nr:hypothetical protein [Planctomycetota bacterium]